MSRRRGDVVVGLPIRFGGSQMIFNDKYPDIVRFRVYVSEKPENPESDRILGVEELLVLAPRIMRAAILALEKIESEGGWKP